MIIETTDNPSQQPEQDFTETELSNRDLVIRMLKWESEYMCSPEGQQRYKMIGSGQFTSLDNEYAFNRRVLREFGFKTDDANVANYRRIFRTYYHSATDYDDEVIQASHYMRSNRCVFYTSPEIHPGDQIPDVPLLTSGPEQIPISLYDAIRDYQLPGSTTSLVPTQQPKEWSRLFICAFSNS